MGLTVYIDLLIKSLTHVVTFVNTISCYTAREFRLRLGIGKERRVVQAFCFALFYEMGQWLTANGCVPKM